MGHMRRGVLGGALLALLGLVTDPAGAQSSKCSSFKLKAAGGAVNRLLTCQAKAVKKHVAVNASCEPKSSGAFDALFMKADHKADCITAASGGTNRMSVSSSVASGATLSGSTSWTATVGGVSAVSNVTFKVDNVEGSVSTADARVVGTYAYTDTQGNPVRQPVSLAATLQREGNAWRLVAIR